MLLAARLGYRCSIRLSYGATGRTIACATPCCAIRYRRRRAQRNELMYTRVNTTGSRSQSLTLYLTKVVDGPERAREQAPSRPRHREAAPERAAALSFGPTSRIE